MAVTQIADVVVPSIFDPGVQQQTEAKTALIQSGVIVRDPAIDAKLAGGGLTFNVPSFRDLADDTDNVSSDDPTVFSTPNKIQTSTEISVRLSRNQSWSSMDLAADLSGTDPVAAILNRVSNYWARRLQAAAIATITGVFADNAAAPSGNDTHTQNDMTVDISGSSYSAGVTDFSAEAMIDAAVTMGDSMGDITLVAVHSIVYARMLKNDLIDFLPDSQGSLTIPTFLGRRIIVDDNIPNASGVFQNWFFGAGAIRMGMGVPETPSETERVPDAGNGGGQDVLYSRVEWAIHPVGHAYVGTAPSGGPSNASTSNNLANAGSWSRVFPERKQIKVARLITREY